jgi:hypothetical protein
MVKYSDDEILRAIRKDLEGRKVNILAPVVRGRKGHYRELFEQVRRQGFAKVRVDGEILDVVPEMKLDRYKVHDIEIVVDRLQVDAESTKRLSDSLQTAMKHGKGSMMVLEHEGKEPRFFSRALMCPPRVSPTMSPRPTCSVSIRPTVHASSAAAWARWPRWMRSSSSPTRKRAFTVAASHRWETTATTGSSDRWRPLPTSTGSNCRRPLRRFQRKLCGLSFTVPARC